MKYSILGVISLLLFTKDIFIETKNKIFPLKYTRYGKNIRKKLFTLKRSTTLVLTIFSQELYLLFSSASITMKMCFLRPTELQVNRVSFFIRNKKQIQHFVCKGYKTPSAKRAISMRPLSKHIFFIRKSYQVFKKNLYFPKKIKTKLTSNYHFLFKFYQFYRI